MPSKEAKKRASANWVSKNPLYNMAYRAKTKFGLEEKDYVELMLKCDNKCMICKKSESTKDWRGSVKQLAIDHCHTTKKIRGLLCFKCNMMLGYAKDNVDTLQSAIEYLK